MLAATHCDASVFEMVLSYNPNMKIINKKNQDLIYVINISKDKSEKIEVVEKKIFSLINNGEYTESLKLAEKLIVSGNKNVKLLTAKAYAEKAKGNFKAALEDIEKAINSGECGEQCERAFIIKLELLQVLKKFDEGLKLADELLKKEFGNRYKIVVKMIVASILWNTKNLDNAMKEIDFLLTQSEILEPEKLTILEMKIKIHAQKGECDLAQKNLNIFIEEAKKSGNQSFVDRIMRELQNEKNKCGKLE